MGFLDANIKALGKTVYKRFGSMCCVCVCVCVSVCVCVCVGKTVGPNRSVPNSSSLRLFLQLYVLREGRTDSTLANARGRGQSCLM